MKNPIARLLEVNGKQISIINADGTWWIPVTPICEVLKIDFKAQHKAIKNDEFLSHVSSLQTTRDSLNKLQEMFCLPEKYVYGWLFSIRSESQALAEYKMICYDVLYNHFHGTLTGRVNVLTERLEIDAEIIDLQSQLLESQQYLKIQELKKRKTQIRNQLKNLDTDLISGQLNMPLN